MKTDPKSTLQLAFQELEVFSIPGVGTFRRSHYPAHIDRESNTIRPPGERFILEKGEGYVDRLEKFLSRSIDKGEEALEKIPSVADIKAWLVRELKKGGELILPGIGRLQLSKEKEVKFQADESPESQQGNFFGLQPLEFTLHRAGKSGEAKDKENVPPVAAAALSGKPNLAKSNPDGKDAKDKPAEPVAVATPPVSNEPEFVDPGEPESPKKRSKAWIWIILLLLLLGAATTGVVMRDQVRDQLVSWGWISGEDINGGGIVDGNGTSGDGVSTDGSDSTKVEGDGTDGGPTVGDGSNGPNEDWKNVEVNDSGDEFEKVGSFAEPGVYYLVIASAKDPSNAKSLRGEMGGKVIRPRYQGNYHRVYSYKSTDKEQVIAKMVESKDKYPQSWIYWLGM